MSAGLCVLPLVGCTTHDNGGNGVSGTIYYIGFDSEEGPEIRWLNCPPGVLKGPFRHPLGLYEHTGVGSGVPLEPQVPELLIDLRTGANPPSDFEPAPGQRWYVSERAKELFERIDPTAFDFRRAHTRLWTEAGEADGPDYFVCDVVKFVDALDEEHSRIIVMGPMRTVSVRGDRNTFFAARVNGHHAFRLMYSPNDMVCTDDFRAAVERAGLTNMRFEKMGMLDA